VLWIYVNSVASPLGFILVRAGCPNLAAGKFTLPAAFTGGDASNADDGIAALELVSWQTPPEKR
jgi:hypothetical protein